MKRYLIEKSNAGGRWTGRDWIIQANSQTAALAAARRLYPSLNCDDRFHATETTATKSEPRTTAMVAYSEGHKFNEAIAFFLSQQDASSKNHSAAVKLAIAELVARNLGYDFQWETDDGADMSWMEAADANNADDNDCYGCRVLDKNSNELASLCGIQNPDANYQREIEAELALDCLELVSAYDRHNNNAATSARNSSSATQVVKDNWIPRRIQMDRETDNKGKKGKKGKRRNKARPVS